MYSVFRVYFLVSDSSDGLLKHLKKQLKTVLNTFGQKNIAGNHVCGLTGTLLILVLVLILLLEEGSLE